MHYNKNAEKKWEQKRKTEMVALVGDRNTSKAETMQRKHC